MSNSIINVSSTSIKYANNCMGGLCMNVRSETEKQTRPHTLYIDPSDFQALRDAMENYELDAAALEAKIKAKQSA